MKNAKLTKNVTSSEMIIEPVRDLKNVDKMRPSAASLVQRYTRNGKWNVWISWPRTVFSRVHDIGNANFQFNGKILTFILI